MARVHPAPVSPGRARQVRPDVVDGRVVGRHHVAADLGGADVDGLVHARAFLRPARG